MILPWRRVRLRDHQPHHLRQNPDTVESGCNRVMVSYDHDTVHGHDRSATIRGSHCRSPHSAACAGAGLGTARSIMDGFHRAEALIAIAIAQAMLTANQP